MSPSGKRVARLALLTLLLGAGAAWLLAEREGGAIPEGEYRPNGRYVGPAPRPRDPRLNLVVLVVDTLREDCVRERDGAGWDMPSLRALAARGARLTQVTAPAPWTFPSLTSLLTGQLPDRHQVDQTPNIPTLPAGVTTYAEILGRGHGYETASITELQLGDTSDTLLQGFRHQRSGGPLRFARPEIRAWNESRPRDKPFFLLLHTYEAHDPYGEDAHPWPARPPTRADFRQVPQPETFDDAQLTERFVLDGVMHHTWLKRNPMTVLQRVFDYFGRGFAANPDPALAERLEQGYRKGVRWLDGEVDQTLRLLESEGLLENTLLLVTSDHGEAFGEHGALNHGRTLHEEHVHVPCVALGPAPFDGGRVLEASVGLVDLLPTFLELARLPALRGVAGRSMLSALQAGGRGRAVLSLEDLTPFKTGRYDLGGAQAHLMSARTADESYLLSYEAETGRIREQLFDRTRDPMETEDRARKRRLGDVPVSAELAEGIAQLRRRMWALIEARLGAGSRRSRAVPPPLPAPTLR